MSANKKVTNITATKTIYTRYIAIGYLSKKFIMILSPMISLSRTVAANLLIVEPIQTPLQTKKERAEALSVVVIMISY